MYTILVCDDDRDIVAALKIYLSAEGYEVLPAYTGKEALDLLDEHTVHLALMDIMMPVMDGIMATAKLREKTNIPIILLTAKSEDTDKVLGLTIGADDYVTKPFNPMEVVARVKSQLRRYTMLGSLQAEQQKKPKVITIGGVTLDDESKSVTVDAYLRVTHLSVGQTYIFTACLELRVRISVHQIIPIRSGSVEDYVVFLLVT